MKRIVFLVFVVVAGLDFVCAKMNITSDSMNILKKGKVQEFLGNVKVRGPGFNVTARKAVSDEEKNIITAKQDVEITYSSGTWNICGRCDSLKMEAANETFFMHGNVKTVYASDTGSATVHADIAVIDYSQDRKARFSGRVNVETGNISVSSGKAIYFKNSETIEFSDSPVAHSIFDGAKTEYSGKVMKVFLKEEKIAVQDNARARVEINGSQLR
jgi:lipopolysaccharide export system protein LptA